ncbi:MAG TPA: hypothetical protein VHG09_10560 [Longimicrobiales bacterium]|nr:hypothetical protein [Longimicrobiales bacterium]
MELADTRCMIADIVWFGAAAAIVWFAGTHLARYADAISERSGLGQALTGLLLLGGITSLPEVATSVTAGLRDNAPLAVNNILGGVALQVVVLAVADAAIGRNALSAVIAHPNVLLIATFDVMLLGLVATGIATGDTAVIGVGIWPAIIAAFYLLAVWRIHRYSGRDTWRAQPQQDPAGESRPSVERDASDLGTTQIALRTTVAAIAVLGAGYVLASRGESIAETSGLGGSFVGAVLVAMATSLPEVSTAIEAVRLRRPVLAFADVFGTNLFDIALIFVIDIAYGGQPVLNEVGTFSLVAALLGIILTTVYLAGLIERRDRVILRMGVDSVAVVVIYCAGLVLLYHLRP